MSFSLFSMTILLIFALIAEKTITKGLSKGFYPSLITLGTFLVGISLSLMLSLFCSDVVTTFVISILSNLVWLIDWILGMFSFHLEMAGIQPFLDGLDSLYTKPDPGILVTVQMIGAAVNILLFWIFLFPVSALVRRLFQSFIRRKFHYSLADLDTGLGRSVSQTQQKLLTILVSTIHAALIAACFFGPLMGMLHRVSSVLRTLYRQSPDMVRKLGLDGFWLADLHFFSTDFVGNIFYAFGGKIIWFLSACSSLKGRVAYLGLSDTYFETLFRHLSENYIVSSHLELNVLFAVTFLIALVCFTITTYRIVISRLLPYTFLRNRKSAKAVCDRGIHRYLFPDGRGIVYQPSPEDRLYIPQYLLAQQNGQKTLTCQLSEDVKAINVRISVFNSKNRFLTALEESLYAWQNLPPILLPPETAFVSVEVITVNDQPVTHHEPLLDSRWVLGYCASVFIITMLVALAIQQTVSLVGQMIMPYYPGAPLAFGKLFPAIFWLSLLLATIQLFPYLIKKLSQFLHK